MIVADFRVIYFVSVLAHFSLLAIIGIIGKRNIEKGESTALILPSPQIRCKYTKKLSHETLSSHFFSLFLPPPQTTVLFLNTNDTN